MRQVIYDGLVGFVLETLNFPNFCSPLYLASEINIKSNEKEKLEMKVKHN